jgi:hypothetical protein
MADEGVEGGTEVKDEAEEAAEAEEEEDCDWLLLDDVED